MANRNECFSDFSKQKTAKERVSHMGDREEYLETPLPLPPSLYGHSLARSLARSYADVITKFSWPDGLPIFLTHGASLARFARWSSAKTRQWLEDELFINVLLICEQQFSTYSERLTIVTMTNPYSPFFRCWFCDAILFTSFYSRSLIYLRIGSCLACVYRVMDALGKFGEHERSVRVARGDSREQL